MRRRPLLNTQTNSKVNVKVDSSVETRTMVEYTGLSLDKRLRQKRSHTYVEAMAKLDAGGVQCKHGEVAQLIQEIKNEFPDLQPYQFPIGIIAKCYLGNEYDVHTLDTKLDIIRHYKKGEGVPTELARGKSLALHPGYEFIEVYTDTLRAVNLRGDVSIIKG
ncbi:hypothetical protein MM300_06995 [Evansella sp. LMS18]|jgi:hypothetical protein|uniref:hypothetical protein n=1 Tax=Evansella sp. LMS18 TaxID=2924033 RepID=UPI0020D08AB1|nr:hypothetical protein [Evansella sp. LMS18]UTR12031.1 hypothetical protein MM300_06995 [Evansella sp. LMS18]